MSSSMRALAVSVSLSLAAAALSAHAAPVEMVFDVTTKSRQLMYIGSSLPPQADPLFQSETFQWAVRFDLSASSVEPVMPSSDGSYLYGATIFEGGAGVSTSPSPYMNEWLAKMPAVAQMAMYGRAYTAAATAVGAQDAEPQNVNRTIYFGTGGSSQAIESDTVTTMNYGRVFSAGFSERLPNSAFHNWTGSELLNHLQSQVGQTYVDRYFEMSAIGTYRVPTQIEALMGAKWQDNLIVENHVHTFGDVRLRSVAVVPEPAFATLLGSGLATMGLIVWTRARRRQAA